jgi:hypothetical protein
VVVKQAIGHGFAQFLGRVHNLHKLACSDQEVGMPMQSTPLLQLLGANPLVPPAFIQNFIEGLAYSAEGPVEQSCQLARDT